MSQNLKEALRWIAVPPSAIMAGLTTFAIVSVVNRFALLSQGIDINGILARVFLEWIGGLTLGAATVYSGTMVAPKYKNLTSLVLTGCVFLFIGFALFPAVEAQNWWGIYGSIATLIGAIATTYWFHKQRVHILQHGTKRGDVFTIETSRRPVPDSLINPVIAPGSSPTGLPWPSAVALLYPIGATINIAMTPAPAAMVAGYGIGNLGYALIAAGIFSGTFRIFGLKKVAGIYGGCPCTRSGGGSINQSSHADTSIAQRNTFQNNRMRRPWRRSDRNDSLWGLQ